MKYLPKSLKKFTVNLCSNNLGEIEMQKLKYDC